ARSRRSRPGGFCESRAGQAGLGGGAAVLITMTRTLQSKSVELPDRDAVLPVLGQAFRELGDFGAEPSMVFAGPDYSRRELDDGGRSVKLPCPLAFFLKRDDFPPDCDPAIAEGGAVFTYMLPEDY